MEEDFLVIQTNSILKTITVKATSMDIKFESFPLDNDQIAQATDYIQNKQPVFLTLGVPEENPNFPDIQTRAMIKKCDVCAETQQPVFTGVSFSSEQVAQLVGFIQGKDILEITIEAAEPLGDETPLFDGETEVVEDEVVEEETTEFEDDAEVEVEGEWEEGDE